MTAVASPFSSLQSLMAASSRSACVMLWLPMAGPDLAISSCEGELAMRRPSCGVYTHHITAKKMSHAVLRMWSAKNRCAKYRVCLASS